MFQAVQSDNEQFIIHQIVYYVVNTLYILYTARIQFSTQFSPSFNV